MVEKVRTCEDFSPDGTAWCDPCRQGRTEFCLDKDSHTRFSQRRVIELERERLRLIQRRKEAIEKAPRIIRWWLRLMNR